MSIRSAPQMLSWYNKYALRSLHFLITELLVFSDGVIYWLIFLNDFENIFKSSRRFLVDVHHTVDYQESKIPYHAILCQRLFSWAGIHIQHKPYRIENTFSLFPFDRCIWCLLFLWVFQFLVNVPQGIHVNPFWHKLISC